jgi:hypothetical protein
MELQVGIRLLGLAAVALASTQVDFCLDGLDLRMRQKTAVVLVLNC